MQLVFQPQPKNTLRFDALIDGGEGYTTCIGVDGVRVDRPGEGTEDISDVIDQAVTARVTRLLAPQLN